MTSLTIVTLIIALERIKATDRTPAVLAEAEGLLNYITKLEFIVLILFWEELLSFTFCSVKLLTKRCFRNISGLKHDTNAIYKEINASNEI